MRSPNVLMEQEEQHIEIARSMYDSTIRNLLEGVGLQDLDAYQLRRLAGVAIVAARRKDTAPMNQNDRSEGA